MKARVSNLILSIVLLLALVPSGVRPSAAQPQPTAPVTPDLDHTQVTVAALMGHSSVATTAIYTQPGEADLVEAVEGLG